MTEHLSLQHQHSATRIQLLTSFLKIFTGHNIKIKADNVDNNHFDLDVFMKYWNELIPHSWLVGSLDEQLLRKQKMQSPLMPTIHRQLKLSIKHERHWRLMVCLAAFAAFPHHFSFSPEEHAAHAAEAQGTKAFDSLINELKASHEGDASNAFRPFSTNAFRSFFPSAVPRPRTERIMVPNIFWSAIGFVLAEDSTGRKELVTLIETTKKVLIPKSMKDLRGRTSFEAWQLMPDIIWDTYKLAKREDMLTEMLNLISHLSAACGDPLPQTFTARQTPSLREHAKLKNLPWFERFYLHPEGQLNMSYIIKRFHTLIHEHEDSSGKPHVDTVNKILHALTEGIVCQAYIYGILRQPRTKASVAANYNPDGSHEYEPEECSKMQKSAYTLTQYIKREPLAKTEDLKQQTWTWLMVMAQIWYNSVEKDAILNRNNIRESILAWLEKFFDATATDQSVHQAGIPSGPDTLKAILQIETHVLRPYVVGCVKDLEGLTFGFKEICKEELKENITRFHKRLRLEDKVYANVFDLDSLFRGTDLTTQLHYMQNSPLQAIVDATPIFESVA